MFATLMFAAATASSPEPLRAPSIPLAHFVQAPLRHVDKTVACFGRTMTLAGANKGSGFQITAMRGFSVEAPENALAKINARLATLPNVVQLSISCAHDAELINIEAAPPNPGRNLWVAVYVMKEGVELSPN